MGTPAPGQAITGQPVVVTNSPQLAAQTALNPPPTIGAIGLIAAPNYNLSNNNGFWSAAVVGAGAQSPAIFTATPGGYGKGRIFVKSAVANTFNVQFSLDGGTTWYTLTQDNAGTPFIIATTATQLLSCRDLPNFVSGAVRLIVITADTVSAGMDRIGI